MTSEFIKIGDLIKGSSFESKNGAKEFYLSIQSSEKATFTEELKVLYDAYMLAMGKCGLSEETLVFSRFYLSDIANQKDILTQNPLFEVMRKGAVSTIQQCPVEGGSVSLLVHHIQGKTPCKKELFTYDSENRRNGAIIHGNNYDFLWAANFYGIGPFDSYLQTEEIFKSYKAIINDKNMTFLDNVVRTWVYVRDVDNHYKGMVDSRRKLFEDIGLTTQTRYIASTGIEGYAKEVNSLVSFDALAISNLKPEQIVSMVAPEHLSPTIDYGVTFERGTRVRFGDRSHLHISGTASIDNMGNVLHLSDAAKQADRTIENIRALLSPQGAGLKDMAYIIAYIRDHKDKRKVKEVLNREIPAEVPIVFLEGAVCRPTWLVELEGLAVITDDTEFPDFF